MRTSGLDIAADGPVFVLTGGRSGSTLLRLILDSHPELACPPETGVATACLELAGVLGVLDGLVQAGVAGEGSVTARSAGQIRQFIDAAYGDYAARHGKRRWCDKSLDSVYCADLLAQLWPRAQFLCLTRHCLDVIASVLEACPRGLSGYGGLGKHAARYPGNSVAAAGSWWLAAMRAMREFEARYPGRCHRVRYEDLVTAPEQVTARILEFLGAAPAPGITRDFRTAAHDANGPGDAKVWLTRTISAASVGRGAAIPAGLFPPDLRAGISEALTALGYRPLATDACLPPAAGAQALTELLGLAAECQPA